MTSLVGFSSQSLSQNTSYDGLSQEDSQVSARQVCDGDID